MKRRDVARWSERSVDQWLLRLLWLLLLMMLLLMLLLLMLLRRRIFLVFLIFFLSSAGGSGFGDRSRGDVVVVVGGRSRVGG